MAARIALTPELLQAPTQRANALGDQAAVRFQLGFARTSKADAALLPFKVRPAPDQPGCQMRELRKLHLQLTLEATCSLRKNIQYQAVTIQNSTAGEFLQVAFLAGT